MYFIIFTATYFVKCFTAADRQYTVLQLRFLCTTVQFSAYLMGKEDDFMLCMKANWGGGS